MTKMTIVHSDDWQGIYIDGMLDMEGHNIEAEVAVMCALRCNVTEVHSRWVDYHWLDERGDLPANMNEVVWET